MVFYGLLQEHCCCTDEEQVSRLCDAVCFVLCIRFVSIQILSGIVFPESETLGGAGSLWEFILYYSVIGIMHCLCVRFCAGSKKEDGVCVISDRYFSLRDRIFRMEEKFPYGNYIFAVICALSFAI